MLYECLAGVPPFQGPDVLATATMRLKVDPVPLRAIRDGVPEHVEYAIAKATSRMAADRWATPKEFAAALRPESGAIRAAALEAATVARRRRPIVAVVISAVVLLGGYAVWRGVPENCAPSEPFDLSRIALVPFADAPGEPGVVRAEQVTELFRAAAARRWSHLQLVSPEGSLGTGTTDGSPTQALACWARRNGAARVVTGRLTKQGDSLLVRAAASDVPGNGTPRLQQQLAIAANALPSVAALDALVVPLLRPVGEPTVAWYADTLAEDFRTWQAFGRGRALVEAGEVDRARTAFRDVATREPRFPPGQAWLAQTSAWLEPNRPNEWGEAAGRALSGAAMLSVRDSLLAAALLAMSDSRFEDACRVYGSLLVRDSTDFAAWFGAGECREWDSVVVREPGAPTGWRFRTSAADAIAHLERSMVYCPPDFGQIVVAAIARLAPVVPRIRPGWIPAGGPRATLGALSGFEGGRMVQHPVPLSDIASGRAGAIPPTLGDAFDEARALRGRIAEQWVRRSPSNPEAHAARALALELQGVLLPSPRGGPSAVEELQQAIRLTTIPHRRLEMGVDRVRLFLKAGEYAAVNRMADSLLRSASTADSASDSLLAGVAILIGRAGQSAEFLESLWRNQVLNTKRDIAVAEALRDASVFRSLAALGVCGDTLSRLEARIDKSLAAVLREQEAAAFRDAYLSRSLQLSASCTGFRPALRTTSDRDFLVRVERAMADGHPDRATAILDTVDRQRAAVPRSEVSLDYVVQESIVRLALGDTARAVSDLSASVEGLRRSASFVLGRVEQPAAVGRALAVLAMVSRGTRPGGVIELARATWGAMERGRSSRSAAGRSELRGIGW